MLCPICDYEDTEEVIVDLRCCNACNHIFKKESVSNKIITPRELHKFCDPVLTLKSRVSEMVDEQRLIFIFPSMNFYGITIFPSLFYRHEYNHYFNQKSLMVLLEKTGLVPVSQENVWSGSICETTLIVEKKR